MIVISPFFVFLSGFLAYSLPPCGSGCRLPRPPRSPDLHHLTALPIDRYRHRVFPPMSRRSSPFFLSPCRTVCPRRRPQRLITPRSRQPLELIQTHPRQLSGRSQIHSRLPGKSRILRLLPRQHHRQSRLVFTPAAVTSLAVDESIFLQAFANSIAWIGLLLISFYLVLF
jgi:hypothetical protein